MPLQKSTFLEAMQRSLKKYFLHWTYQRNIQIRNPKIAHISAYEISPFLQLSRHSCVRRSSKISPTENPFGGSASTSFLHFWRFWLGKWRNAPGKETLHYVWNFQILSKNSKKWNNAFLGDLIIAGNALARVQRVHKPADLWNITFCTRWFWGYQYYMHPLFWDPELSRMHLHPQIQIPNAFPE